MSLSGRAQLFLLAALAVLWSLPSRGEDFDSGKTGQALFASNCASCHHTARGLGRRKSSGALGTFMREHYTASATSADRLTDYLVSLRGDAHAPTTAPPSGVRHAVAAHPRPGKLHAGLRPPASIPAH